MAPSGYNPALSTPEFGVWLASRHRGAVFNVHRMWALDGSVEPAALRAAFDAVLARHPVFARRIEVRDGVPGWRPCPPGPADFAVEASEVDPEQWALAEGRHQFDLATDSPLRARLLRVGARRWLLSLVVHHIAVDGLSLDVLLEDLGAALAGELGAPRAVTVPHAPEATDYWPTRLAGAHWPRVFPANDPAADAAMITLPLSDEQAVAIQQASRKLRATPYVFGLAALCLTLRRYGAARDVMVASPFANRSGDTVDAVGCYAQMVPIRQQWTADTTGAELVGELRGTVAQALAHLGEPVREIADLFGGRTDGQTVSFQTHGDLPVPRLPGCTVTPAAEPHNGFTRFDLELDLWLGRRERAVALTYRSSIGEPAARALLETFRQALLLLASTPDRSLDEHEPVDPAARASASLRGPALPPALPTVLERLDTQAERTPDAVAVSDEDTSLTFAELCRRGIELAGRLRAAGVRDGTRVGVLMSRGVELVVTVFAVWRAGGCYLPLDPSAPDERLDFLLADSGAGLLVCDDASRAVGAAVPRLGDGPGVLEPWPAPGASDLAYLLHTSGTTGRPKGVLVEHGSLAAFVAAQIDGPTQQRVGLTAAVSFDVFFAQLLHVLRGACVVVAGDDVYRNPQRLVSWIRAENVDYLDITPSMLAAAREFGFDELLGAPLRWLELGGEAVSAETWASLRAAGIAGENGYGPTEVTITATAAGYGVRPRPTIGRPVAGVSAMVLGPDLRPVPPGVAGELYLGGPQVTRGYLNAPGTTADRFLPDSLAGGGARMYRTGDLVVATRDARLDYLGRVDDQLKVRGQRVDPYEVEAELRAHPGVADAYVARRTPDPADGLAAYVVSTVDPTVLREHLADRLPMAAVPARVTAVDSFPLTPSGKVDEAALAAFLVEPETAGAVEDDEVSAAWLAVLGRPPRSVDENFFTAGGSSIGAARLVAHVNNAAARTVDLAEFFVAPTVAGLRHALRRAEPVVTRAATGEELSAAQRRLWLLHRIDGDSHEFTVPWAVRVTGDLAPAAVETAWRRVLADHDELRLRLRDDDRLPRRDQWAVEEMPVRHRTLAEAELASALDATVVRAFDLVGEPLVELDVFRLGPAEHVLAFSAHHLVVDRRSVELLMDALFARLAGQPAAAPGHRYAEYAALPAGGREDLAFWRAELADAPARTELTIADRNPSTRGWHGAHAQVPIDDWSAIAETARRNGTTPLALALAAVAVTTSRYGATDLVVGTTMDCRPAGHEDVVGLYVNPVPVRVAARAGTVAELLSGTHDAVLRAHAHRHVPFDELVTALGVRPDPSSTPVFQILVDYEPPSVDPDTELGLEWLTPRTSVAKYDLAITLAPHGLRVEYRTDRYRERLVTRFASDVVAALLGMARGDDQPVARLLADADPVRTRELLSLGTGDAIPVTSPVYHQVAGHDPDETAVVFGAETLTYGQLWHKAGRIAAYLAEAGVRPGDLVGVVLPRSADMVAAVLGVHRAGAGYVPVDPAHPRERIAAAFADAQVTAVIDGPVPDTAADPPPVSAGPGAPAYAIYTSGTTGKPKGVLVTHGQLAASTAARRQVYPETPVFLLVSPLSFDSSVAGLWGTLAAGGCLVIAGDDDVRDPERLLALIHDHKVTDLLCVPSLHDLLLREAARSGAPPGLREVIVAGEALTEAVLSRHFGLLPGVTLVNEYGPTEATVWSTYRRYTEPGPVDIGGPVPGARLYVLDESLRLAPPGATGELYVGGAGVSRGYLGRPAATAAAFLPDPFVGGGARMYGTGDRVRWSDEGTLEFLGRLDEQVKIRGHRVELGEVEAALLAVPGVRTAAVIAHRNTLVGFVTADTPLDPARVRRAVADRLPPVLTPTAVHQVEQLPRTTNGKVDRVALAAAVPEAARTEVPTDELSRQVCAAWTEVLDVPSVPSGANFFDVGGHSLLVPLLQDALRRHTGVHLPVLDLFRFTTVSDQANRLRGGTEPEPEAPARAPDRGRALLARQRRVGGRR